MTQRVQEHWDIAQEHYAIQDGLKAALEIIAPWFQKIIEFFKNNA